MLCLLFLNSDLTEWFKSWLEHSPYLAVNPVSPTLRDSIYELQSHIGIVRRMPVSSLGGEASYDGHNLNLDWNRVKLAAKRWLGQIPTIPLHSTRPVNGYQLKP